MPQNLFPWNNPKGLREQAQTSFAYNTNTATSATTLTAAQMSGGADKVVLDLTGTLTAAANATTDTATNIIAAIPQGQRYVGATYILRIINDSSGAYAWTVVAGSGVTLTGTATIAQHTWREFLVTLTNISTPAVSLQGIGTGTNS